MSLGSKALAAPPSSRQQLIAALRDLADQHELVIAHAERPGVEPEHGQRHDPIHHTPLPLDLAVAGAQGVVGYWLTTQLDRGPGSPRAAALVTRVVVDRHDPEFASDDPHPEPVDVVEISVIADLLAARNTVVCAGGGGICVTVEADGTTRPTSATVDVDAAAGLLGRELGADVVLFVTDVPYVFASFESDAPAPIHHASSTQLRAVSLDPMTIGRKLTAACDFVEATGGFAAIGSFEDIPDLITGTAGTQIRSGLHPEMRIEEHAEASMTRAHDERHAVPVDLSTVGGTA